MIFKDKDILRKQDYLFNLILAMARIQKIHPTVLKEEAQQIKDNALFMANMMEGWRPNAINKNNVK
jgi:hypothetical protein